VPKDEISLSNESEVKPKIVILKSCRLVRPIFQLLRGKIFMINKGQAMSSERDGSQCQFFCHESLMALTDTESGPLLSESLAVISS